MKTYTKPVMDITSYEAEKIMLASSVLQQSETNGNIKSFSVNFN